MDQKIDELWSANNRVIMAHIDQTKWTFFRRVHFGHYGVVPLKFLEIDPGYLAHTRTGTGISVWATITSGLVWVSSWKFIQSTCCRAGVITRVQFSEGPPPKIWVGEKTSKIRLDFWQLSTLIANTFGMDRYVESRKNHYKLQPLSTTTPSTLRRKNLANFGPQTTELKNVAHIDQPKWTFFGRLHFGH